MRNSDKAFKFFCIAIFALICSKVSAQVPSEGLVAHWPFNGNISDTVASYDLTGNGTITFEEGKRGQSVRIQNSAYLSTAALKSYYTGNSPFTIAFWYKTSGLVNWSDAVFSTGKTGTPGLDITYKEEFIQVRRFVWGAESYVVQTSYDPFPDYYSYVDGLWHHILMTFDGTNTALYVDGNLIEEKATPTAIGNDNPLYFGVERPGAWPVDGNYDDACIYSRALSSDEVRTMYNYSTCSMVTINDTTLYHVSDTEFQNDSPMTVYNRSDTLTTTIQGCDSIVDRYIKFMFDPYYYTDTIEVQDTIWIPVNDTIFITITDTTYVTVTDSVSVTDTLIIDAVLTGIDPPDNINTLKIYPNPAKDHIYINTGEYTKMDGYQLKIIDQLGAVVFETIVEESLYEVNLSTWTGIGLYYVQVIDSGGSIIDIRKIILQ